MKIRVLNPMDGWAWYSETWDDIKGAKLDFFFVAVLMYLPLFILGRFPFLGSALSSFVAPLFYVGTFYVSRRWAEAKQKEISALFTVFKDNALFRKLLPLCLVSMGFGVINGLIQFAHFPVILAGPLTLCLAVIQGAVLYFAPPLIVFHSYEVVDAMKLSVKAVVDNLPTFVVAFLMGTLLILMGIATLFVGLLFLMPVFVYLPYHIYKSVFAGTGLEQIPLIEKAE